MAVCSWNWLGAQAEEIGGKLRKGIFDVLGDGPDFSADGHEIMVTLPTRHHMKMQMIGNASTSGGAEIKANIDAMRLKMAAKHGAAGGEHRHDPAVFFGGEFGEIGQMSARGNEQMAIGIGVAIEQHHRQIIAIQQQMGQILARRSGRFKQAPG